MRLKIIIGYAILAVVLILSTWMMYINTRSLSAVNTAARRMVERRDVTDSLVYSLLQAGNAERSVCLGDSKEWHRYDAMLTQASVMTARLKELSNDSSKRQRLDSLALLLAAKRANTLAVMEQMGSDVRQSFYDDKVKALRSGRDSVVIHPKNAATSGHNQETVYKIMRNRKGFFRRLADAFRRQRTDTLSTVSTAVADTASLTQVHINIADSVADALMQINGMEQRATSHRREAIAGRNQRLQWVSVQLAERTSSLLEDIQADEHAALRSAVEKAVSSRRNTIMRVCVLGLLAIVAAALFIFYTMRDIRREKRSRQRLVEAKAQTEKLMMQRERLLLTITHDIKAPTASIAGFIDLLADSVSGRKASVYLDNMRSSARHILRLVASLLDYHRLESGETECHAVTFSPSSLFVECVEGMQPLAAKRGLQLNCLVSPEMHDVICRADAFHIRQIVDNLLGNALKYTDEGSVSVAARLSCGSLVFSVADTGIGMTADEQQRIFQAFTRLPGAQGREGVGLGLSITHEMVQLLGGTISVESQKGHGSRFTVSVPVTILDAATARQTAANAPAANALSGSVPERLSVVGGDESVRIVIVDDDDLQLQLLREMFGQLAGAHWEIHATQHADEAVRLVRSLHPHILFTDVEMPEMNGTELLRLVADSPAHKVAMTAHDISIAEELRKRGFDACLFKPFRLDALAGTVSRLTGLAVHAAETDYFSPLTSFADGDKEAEGQILAELRKSVEGYMTALGSAVSLADTAQVAHKVMPVLAMLHGTSCDWLLPLTPERIATTSAEERECVINRLKDELEDIMQRLDKK